MAQLGITSMTVSISTSDKDYGKGSDYFCNITSKTSDADLIPLEKIEQVVDEGLKMFLTTFQTILTSRFATGNLGAKEFKELWEMSETRFAKMHKFLAAQSVSEEKTPDAAS
jgi:hypothetical protein